MISRVKKADHCELAVMGMFFTFIIIAVIILTVTGVLGQVLIDGGAPQTSGNIPYGFPNTGVVPHGNYIQSQGIYHDARPDTVRMPPNKSPYINNGRGNTSNPYTTFSPNDMKITGGDPYYREPQHPPFFKIETTLPNIPDSYNPNYSRSPLDGTSIIRNERPETTGLFQIKQDRPDGIIRIYDSISGKYQDYKPNSDGSYIIYNNVTGRYEQYIGNPMQPKQLKDEFYRRKLE